MLSEAKWIELLDFIKSCEDKKLDWESWDCSHFVAEAAAILCGRKAHDVFELSYSSLSDVRVLLKEKTDIPNYNEGLVKIVEYCGLNLGAELCKGWPFRGDILVVQIKGHSEYVCGICTGEYVALLHEEGGITYISLRDMDVKLIVRF